MNGGPLSPDSFDAKDGWSVTRRDESTDDVEASLKDGKQKSAEVERIDGQTKREIGQKVTAPKTN